MDKAQLLRWLGEEQQRWELLLAAIGETRMDQPGVNGDWSMRSVIAHLTGWQRWLVTRLQAASEGQAAPAPPWPASETSDDAINAWIDETYRTRTVREVLDDVSTVHARLLTIVESLPDDTRMELLEAKFPVVWVHEQRFAVGEFFHHFYDDHAADVRAWLERGV
jgi:hypothetical protein